MLSHVANSLFWLGRYLERAENYARFIDVNFNLSMDLPPGMEEQWKPLLKATGDMAIFQQYYKEVTRENAIRFLAFDKQNMNSIIASVTYARENARIVRENISREMWEILNDLYHKIHNQKDRKVWKKEDNRDHFKKIKNDLQLICGAAFGTSPRTLGWYFTQAGVYMERADKTSRILDVKYHILLPSPKDVGSPLDFLHWIALLKSVSGYNAYRRMYGRIEPAQIVDYLVLNKYFPRSILFCLMNAEDCLREISGYKGAGYSNVAEKNIGSLRSDLEYADIDEVFHFGLHEYLDLLQKKMNNISTSIEEQYFRLHIPTTSQQLQS